MTESSNENPFQRPNQQSFPVRHLKPMFIRLLIAGGLLLGIGFLLILLLLPAVRDTRPVAYRTQCKNNLKQITLALANYQDVWGQPPPRYTASADGQPLHSWRTLILPFLEQQELYDRIDLSVPWNDQGNAALLEQIPECYRCPKSDPGSGLTTYIATSDSDRLPRIDGWESGPADAEASTRLVVLETSSGDAIPWMAPVDGGRQFLLSITEQTEMPHGEGLNAALTDGAMHFLGRMSSTAERKRLLGEHE